MSRGPRAGSCKLKRGRYEVIVKNELGFIRDVTSGEMMHPIDDPVAEARLLYVEQSRLIERLQMPNEPILWSYGTWGLGAGANAMAAILAVEGSIVPADARRLALVSFENDLDSLKLALDHMRWFKHLRHAAPRALLADQRWINRRRRSIGCSCPATSRCANSMRRRRTSFSSIRSRSRRMAHCGHLRRFAN